MGSRLCRTPSFFSPGFESLDYGPTKNKLPQKKSPAQAVQMLVGRLSGPKCPGGGIAFWSVNDAQKSGSAPGLQFVINCYNQGAI